MTPAQRKAWAEAAATINSITLPDQFIAIATKFNEGGYPEKLTYQEAVKLNDFNHYGFEFNTEI